MKQYIELGKRILEEGVMVRNERTGKGCLTVINADFVYDVDEGKFPMLTTKKVYWKMAIAEVLGYIKGFDSAEQFRELGTTSWDANANAEVWQKNPACKGKDDIGLAYGAIARNFPVEPVPEHVAMKAWQEALNSHLYTIEELMAIRKSSEPGQTIDLVQKVYDDLRQGIDNRFETITFLHPGAFHLACLRPCMYEHQFSILDGTLYLNSTQRSVDVPLGLCWNMLQCYFLLAVMAQITGLKPGKVYHKMVNVHIYEDQIELFKEQMAREPIDADIKFIINPESQTLDDLMEATLEDFSVEGYEGNHHPAIAYPFSV